MIAIACTEREGTASVLILGSLDDTQTDAMAMRRIALARASQDPLLVMALGALASEPSYCWDAATAETFARLLVAAKVSWCGPVTPVQGRSADLAAALREAGVSYMVRPEGQRTLTEIATAVLMLARARYG